MANPVHAESRIHLEDLHQTAPEESGADDEHEG
jgi:hypothetical protein